LKFGLKFENFEICHKKLKWKNWNFSFFIFEFWNENFCLIFLKKIGHITKWKWKKNWICHRDKTSYNTRIPPIPPMHITLYHMSKLWWYTINLSRWILSYWSFPTVVWGDMVHRKRALIFYPYPPHLRWVWIWIWTMDKNNRHSSDWREERSWVLVLLLPWKENREGGASCCCWRAIHGYGNRALRTSR
jgi:hypothetical protein